MYRYAVTFTGVYNAARTTFCWGGRPALLQGKPQDPDRHGAGRPPVGGDGSDRAEQPLHQAEDAHTGGVVLAPRAAHPPGASRARLGVRA